MGIKFSDHALEQIKRRGLSRKKILETVKSPDSELSSSRGRRLLQKKFGGKVLEVVTVEVENEVIIVTAYFLYEIKLRSKN